MLEGEHPKIWIPFRNQQSSVAILGEIRQYKIHKCYYKNPRKPPSCTCSIDNNAPLVINKSIISRPGEFATCHFLLEVFGVRFCRYENAIKTSPRDILVDQVAAALRPLLESINVDSPDDPNYDEQCDAIRDILQDLKGENYESYVRPSPDVLAKSAYFTRQTFGHSTKGLDD